MQLSDAIEGRVGARRTSLLRNRDFGFVWWSGLVSMTGNWALMVALPMYVYQETGSTLATGGMLLASTIPRLLLGSVAGVFADRWDRRRTVIACNLLLALVVAPLALVPVTGALWLVYAAASLLAAVSQFLRPAEHALLPTLVAPEQLAAANALNALNTNIARFIGPAVGGLLVALAGLQGIVVLNMIALVAAALLIYLVRTGRRPAAVAAQGAPVGADASEGGSARPARAAADWRSEWLAGIALVRRTRVLALLVAVVAITSLGEGVFGVLLAPFVVVAFGGGTLELGWLVSAQAVGGIAGGAAVAAVARRIDPRRLLGFGALLLGAIDLVIINYPLLHPGILPALVLMAAAGAPAAAFGAGYLTLLQKSAGDEYLGRASGVLATVAAATGLVGTLLAGVLGDLVGVIAIINVQGVAYAAAGALAILVLRVKG